MCALERRLNERAMHETFLVIKTVPNDMGNRPVSGPFTSPDLTVGPDGRPRAVVWNLGTREVKGVITEFATIPAGMPIHPNHKKVIGHSNLANISANGSVQVTCNAIWPRSSHADVLIATAYHPDLDPVKQPCDPLTDRHVGQMTYAWAGTFEGICNGTKVNVQIRPANQGLYRLKAFVAVGGRLPSNPQVDRTMAPTGQVFRWQQTYSFKKEDWELVMLDNQRVSARCRSRYTDQSGRTDPELNGNLTRQ